MIARAATAGDRVAVHEALQRSGAFSEEEVGVALEMFDAGLAGDYALPGVEVDGVLRGYACIGRAWLTLRSWYLYWICVHPAFQGLGAGQALQRSAEEWVLREGGDRLVLETSARAAYQRSRRFYERAGFELCGRLPDFYAPGDDGLIYCKLLGARR